MSRTAFASNYLRIVESELRSDHIRAGMEGDKLLYETDKALFIRCLNETSASLTSLSSGVSYSFNKEQLPIQFASALRNLRYLDELINIHAKDFGPPEQLKLASGGGK